MSTMRHELNNFGKIRVGGNVHLYSSQEMYYPHYPMPRLLGIGVRLFLVFCRMSTFDKFVSVLKQGP